MHSLIELAPYGKNGEMQMVVETPRGSNIKLEYEPKLRAFTVSRALPLERDHFRMTRSLH